ncbi:PqqD family peptide modification chaperone [Clostridium perfringens]|nr:PqqD family peptide modification chaperone [Clostridium perfringens]
MFPQLIEKSFVKKTPNKTHIFSFFIDGYRRYVGINESASSILELCDGSHTIEDIIFILSNKYKENSKIVEENVKTFLKDFINSGIIIDQKKEKNDDERIIKGSSEVYYPNAICWEITNYCPLNCRHCYLPNKNNCMNSKEDIDSILKMIDYMGVNQVQITGGEVLTHPELKYIVNKLINKGIITIISTSGFGFDKDMFQYLVNLKKVKGSMLRVSIDGNSDTHNYIRRNNYAYKNALNFIKAAIDNGITCQVETCLINQSKRELEELVCITKELGVNSIEIGYLLEQGNAKENNLKLKWNPEEYVDFISYLDSKYANEIFKIRLPEHESNKKNCGAGYNIIRIKPNFDVTPCTMTEFKMGNLRINTIFDIMHKCNKIFYEIQCPRKSICKDCKKIDDCKNCIAIGYNNKDKVKNCKWFKTIENSIKPLLD